MKFKELFTNIGAKVGGAIGICGLIITGAEVKNARDLWYFMTDSDNLLIMLLLFAMIAFTAFMVNELGIALLWWI